MAKKPGPKAGLPPGENAQRLTVTVDEMTLRRLRVLGGENLSKGVRVAARVAFDRYQRETDASTRSGIPPAAGHPA